MKFQRLIGILTKSQDDTMFEDIVGYDHIKRLFRMSLESDSTTHILLTGPPPSAKTMFLCSLLQHLKKAYFIDGGNSTKAGIIEYLFENRPEYLLIDEIDKSASKHQTFLLNLLETGIISETKFGKTRETKMDVSVFASHHSNNCCIYPRNGSGSIFEHGLDDGTIMAQRGDAAPNYDDCIGDGGNQATYGNQVSTYCSGLVQGYNSFGR
jgi:hypothetical protein